MSVVVLDALDLAALLCSRVCHDLISPTGAIVNGLEVLEEKDSDEETKTFALDLIKRSARTASAARCRINRGRRPRAVPVPEVAKDCQTKENDPSTVDHRTGTI